MMNPALKTAKAILDSISPYDADTVARGRRAHARAIATIEAADRLTGIEKQLHIANLIAFIQMGGPSTDRARAEIDALLWPTAVKVEV